MALLLCLAWSKKCSTDAKAVMLNDTEWLIEGDKITDNGDSISFRLIPRPVEYMKGKTQEPTSFTLSKQEHPNAKRLLRDYMPGSIISLRYSEEEVYETDLWEGCPLDQHIRFTTSTAPKSQLYRSSHVNPDLRKGILLVWMPFCYALHFQQTNDIIDELFINFLFCVSDKRA